MGHLPPPTSHPRLRRKLHLLTDLKFLPHERLSEPQRSRVLASVFNQHADHAAALARRVSVHLLDSPTNRLHFFVVELTYRPHVRQVLIIPRKIKEQIARGVYA